MGLSQNIMEHISKSLEEVYEVVFDQPEERSYCLEGFQPQIPPKDLSTKAPPRSPKRAAQACNPVKNMALVILDSHIYCDAVLARSRK